MNNINSNADLNICLHRFLGGYWWMDGKCFLLLKEYLDNYGPVNHEFSDKFIDELLYVLIHKRDLTRNRDIFQIRGLGERALLLSFTHVGINTGELDRLINIEFIYKEDEKIQTQEITFNINSDVRFLY